MTYREPAIVESLDDEQASANAWTTIERALGRSPLWPNGNPRRVTNLGPRGKGVGYPFDFASKDELKLLVAAAQDADLTDSLEPDGVLLGLPGTFGSNRRFVSRPPLGVQIDGAPPERPEREPPRLTWALLKAEADAKRAYARARAEVVEARLRALPGALDVRLTLELGERFVATVTDPHDRRPLVLRWPFEAFPVLDTWEDVRRLACASDEP
jgi:hypothetical protein